jgi:DNA-binding NarL/FixJ family response regulator
MSRIRVVVADDQRVVRDGLAMIVGLLDGVDVVGTACDGVEAVELAGRERPDVVLMDLRMPRMEGAEATRRIRTALPETQCSCSRRTPTTTTCSERCRRARAAT